MRDHVSHDQREPNQRSAQWRYPQRSWARLSRCLPQCGKNLREVRYRFLGLSRQSPRQCGTANRAAAGRPHPVPRMPCIRSAPGFQPLLRLTPGSGDAWSSRNSTSKGVAPANSDRRDQILIGSKEMVGSFNSRSTSLILPMYSSFVTQTLSASSFQTSYVAIPSFHCELVLGDLGR